MARASAPSGYRIGQVHPPSTYSPTFSRHSSAVPDAVIIWTMSSGTSFDAATTWSWVAGHVEHAPDVVEQRFRDTRRLHDVRLLAQVLRDEQPRRVQRHPPVGIERAHDELRAIDVVERTPRALGADREVLERTLVVLR